MKYVIQTRGDKGMYRAMPAISDEDTPNVNICNVEKCIY